MSKTIQKEIESKKTIFLYLGLLISAGIILRLYFFPYNIPIVVDGLAYFSYASEIVEFGHLPENWITINNGWPIFLSFWFSIINLENGLGYMQMQRIISLIISSGTIIPIFFMCKKFVEPKYALVASSLFIFEPRIILNSLLGSTDPLYIFLGVTSLSLLLNNKQNYVFASFGIAALCTIVRGEGVFFFFAIIIIFLLKNKITKNSIKIIVPSIGIFFLILTPVMLQRIDVVGGDGIFLRAASSVIETSITAEKNNYDNLIEAVGTFGKYLGWVMIPMFILFVPFGTIRFFQNITSKTNFIIIVFVLMSLPALYAYSVPAEDTRYLYFIYPIFCLLSAFALREYFKKLHRFILVGVIIVIISSSVIFFDYKKDDWRMDNSKEIEFVEISKEITEITTGVNHHPVLGRYIWSTQFQNDWPIIHTNGIKTEVLSLRNFNDLEEYILENKDQLTHIISNNDERLHQDLRELYLNPNRYDYLIEVYDSKNNQFEYGIKIFKIDYGKMNLRK